MFYQTTEAHEALRQKVRAFAEAEVKPIAFMLDQENRFPREAVTKMGELGLMGIPYETKYGGAGLDALSYAIAVEELSRVDGGTGVILSAHTSLGTYPIYAFGTEEQKMKYLPDLCSGKKVGAFGLTEPNAGSDAGGTETTAEDKGDHWLLNGEKIFITNGGEADTYVVFAVTTPDIGTRGISAFIVEKGWEGFTFEPHYDKMGIRSSATCQLNFNNVKIPKENLLGKEGQGFKIAMSTLDGGRIGIAAQALGIAQGAFEAAVEYSKDRVQFGRPICQQQSIAFKIADMATKLRCARMLVYSAAELKQAHVPYGMESAMAKMYASDIALEVTNDAVQIHGGLVGALGDAQRLGGNADTAAVQSGHGDLEALALLAQQVFLGDLDVVEVQLAGGGGADAHFVVVGLKGEALPALLHDEGGNAPGADVRRGDGKDHVGVRLAAVGDEDLLAVEEVVVAHVLGGGLGAAGVGAGVRLR